MTAYLITYDLVAPGRNYKPLIDLLSVTWKAKRIVESVWLAELKGDSAAIRDLICQKTDANDRIVVIEIPRGSDWAYKGALAAGADFLTLNITPAANAA